MPAVGELKTRRAVPIFGIGNQARSPFISSVDRVNAVVEMAENGRQQVAVIGLPGLVEVANFSPSPARGIFVREGSLTFYIAAGREVFEVNPSEAVKILDLGTSIGPVWMDENGTELFINDGLTASIYTFATKTITQITDADYPAGARGGVYLQGRFWVFVPTGPNKGRVYGSDVKNGLSWDGLNFFEPSSKPDNILAIERQADDLVILGTGSLEWWSGQPTPIVGALGFQPSASANTEVGGVSERGFAKVGQQFFFLGQSGGDSSVYRLNGYRVEPIGTAGLDVELTQLTNDAAACTGYAIAGHDIFQITIANADPTKAMTWIYDLNSGQWAKRESVGKPYYRGLYAVGTAASVYITDAFTGKLYHMHDGIYTEAGEAVPFEIVSQHLLQEGDHITIDEIQVDMETGKGNPVAPGDDPYGILSVSKDGGQTWAIERHLPLGKAGEYLRRARDTQFGTARDFAVKFRVTDPVPRRVTGAYLGMTPSYA